MYIKLLVVIFTVCLQLRSGLSQRQWISQTTTAQEMRNPATWYRPYYQAAAEAYSNYLQNAREIRNQLWQQAYATGAFGGGPGGSNNPSNVPNNPSNVPNNPSNVPNNPSNVPNNPSNMPNNPSNVPNNPSVQNQNWG